MISLDLPPDLHSRLEESAKKLNKTVADLALSLIVEALRDPTACLVPSCPERTQSLGLCRNHYQRYRYYESEGKLNEGWCVRNRRIFPPRGKTIEDYAIQGGETLDTLPSEVPSHKDDTRWFFGWPFAQVERSRLEGRKLT